ncbi:putative RNA-directed DNA polymerase from transposon X-element [Toxocara canis]|uniref:Putative RNA-directed DNA polymerase from transposon X-element n=1 Tax=Toxocara canis TaxID=6265 RepID=A0A0B2UNI5_TOXCA|nr:putative RNA-directed DNA polymerase from transposon X-element [Toxocara canis]
MEIPGVPFRPPTSSPPSSNCPLATRSNTVNTWCAQRVRLGMDDDVCCIQQEAYHVTRDCLPSSPNMHEEKNHRQQCLLFCEAKDVTSITGSEQEPANYRPISLLSCVSKLIERCIHPQTYQALEPFLPNCQHAFRRRHSITTALAEICEKILVNMENNNLTFIVQLDAQKAYDTVNPYILLQKIIDKVNPDDKLTKEALEMKHGKTILFADDVQLLYTCEESEEPNVARTQGQLQLGRYFNTEQRGVQINGHGLVKLTQNADHKSELKGPSTFAKSECAGLLYTAYRQTHVYEIGQSPLNDSSRGYYKDMLLFTIQVWLLNKNATIIYSRIKSVEILAYWKAFYGADENFTFLVTLEKSNKRLKIR